MLILAKSIYNRIFKSNLIQSKLIFKAVGTIGGPVIIYEMPAFAGIISAYIKYFSEMFTSQSISLRIPG